jgi:hypothetical protein
MPGSAMFERLRKLRPELSVTDLVAPFNFEWKYDAKNKVSLEDNNIFIIFNKDSVGEFTVSLKINKIGFYTERHNIYIKFETSDSREGLLWISLDTRDMIYFASMEVFDKTDSENNANDNSYGTQAYLHISKPIYDFFFKKVQEQSKEEMPKRQAAQMAWNTRKHVMAVFGAPRPNNGGTGHGAGASRRGGNRKQRRKTLRRRK